MNQHITFFILDAFGHYARENAKIVLITIRNADSFDMVEQRFEY